MIIAGPCLFNFGDFEMINKTAAKLDGIADVFRVKIWGGGTRVDKWYPGIGEHGIRGLLAIQEDHNFPVITEVQVPNHIYLCDKFYGIWIGARNSNNYGLLQELEGYRGKVFIKRSPGSTIDETINLYYLIKEKFNILPYIIERGINNLDRNYGRWSPDLKLAYVLKGREPVIFENLVIDCSHSAGKKEFIEDIYNAFKAIGINHFMFEVFEGKSKTDVDQILTVSELEAIISPPNVDDRKGERDEYTNMPYL